MLQLATGLAIVVYFWRDILDLVKTFLALISLKQVENDKKNLLYAIVLGTIPAVFFGLLLEKKMDTIFRSPHLVAWMLLAGTVLMFFAERMYRANASISNSRGFVLGLFQSLALVPGVSRSGATISGGMILGLSRETATRFSFLLSIPIIIGAGLKKTIGLAKIGGLTSLGFPLLISATVAFLVGLFSIQFLIKYLKNNSLKPFIIYRIIFAIYILVWL